MPEHQPQEGSEPVLIAFIFGSSPIVYVDLSASPDDFIPRVDGAIKAPNSDTIILGIQMSVVGNLIELLTSMVPGVKNRVRGMQLINKTLNQRGLQIVDEVACLPSLDNPRFLYPIRDHASHLMLLRSFLLPRRYSLGLWERVLLRAYILFAAIFRSPKVLCRGMFLQVRKC